MMAKRSCVAYMRYSSDNQTENSIEYQRVHIENYCRQNNLSILAEFVDEGYTATNDKRPDFQRMIGEAMNKPLWDTIVVYDLSRFFRNKDDATRYKADLRDRGFHIISVTEPFTQTNEGSLFEAILDIMNDFYSKDNGKKTHAGMAVKASKGLHCGGVAPLGYDVDANGRLIVNEDEAEVVRMIFSLYTTGYSYKRMATYLNARGMKTKAGKPFTKNSFYHILTQEKYVGIYRWNQRKAKNSRGQHNNHAYKPEEQQTVIRDGCPCIIEKEMFQKAQKALAEHSNGKALTKSRHHYVLSGMQLIKCSKCGKYMVGKVTRSHGKEYTTYSCPNHKGGLCPTKDIPAQQLDQYVSCLLAKKIITAEALPQLIQLATSESATNAKIVKRRLDGVKKSIANIVKAIEADFSPALSERLRELEDEKKQLDAQISATVAENPTINTESNKLLRKAVVAYLQRPDTPEARVIFKEYVYEILISNEEIVVTLNV